MSCIICVAFNERLLVVLKGEDQVGAERLVVIVGGCDASTWELLVSLFLCPFQPATVFLRLDRQMDRGTHLTVLMFKASDMGTKVL